MTDARRTRRAYAHGVEIIIRESTAEDYEPETHLVISGHRCEALTGALEIVGDLLSNLDGFNEEVGYELLTEDMADALGEVIDVLGSATRAEDVRYQAEKRRRTRNAQ